MTGVELIIDKKPRTVFMSTIPRVGEYIHQLDGLYFVTGILHTPIRIGDDNQVRVYVVKREYMLQLCDS